MSIAKGSKRVYFPKVKEAREALAERAKDILEQYLAVVKSAHEAGDYEVASESLRWLMEHMPMDVEGTSMVDVSVDKVPQISKGSEIPAIRIGIALGGVSPTKELSAANVIDVEDYEETDLS